QLLSPTAACIQFATSSYSVEEGAGHVTLTVTRNGNTNQTSTVHVSTADGTAAAPGDYNTTNADLLFNPGDTSIMFDVTINDTEDESGGSEPSKTFTATLSNS